MVSCSPGLRACSTLYTVATFALLSFVTSSPISSIGSKSQSFKVDVRAQGATGKTHLTPIQNGTNWIAPVNIGGQTLNLWMDTGSSEL